MAQDKGIRAFTRRAFVEMLPLRAQLGNRAWRKEVRGNIIHAMEVTESSASTHYNDAFQFVKKAIAAGTQVGAYTAEQLKEMVGDLGRAPKEQVVEVAPVQPVAPLQHDFAMCSYWPLRLTYSPQASV
jgi:hypothetical protein